MYTIANSYVYRADLLGIWAKVYAIFSDGIERAFTLSVTLGNQLEIHHLVVLGTGRGIWSADGISWNDTAIKQCDCDMKVILCKGCQCGGA